jgi:Ca2+:H+ antiporter
VSFRPSLNWLLIFVPLAIVLEFWPGGANRTAVFICSGLGIIPLAGWIGRATESLVAHVGEGVGALLNATFGNAAELIIAILALWKGLTGVVKASITGSIIGNVLLVLGLSILLGGTKYSQQHFNKTAARTSAISLSLAAIALVIPSVFHLAARTGWSQRLEQQLSFGIAAVLFVTYVCVLGFTLKTHRQLFVGGGSETETNGDD